MAWATSGKLEMALKSIIPGLASRVEVKPPDEEHATLIKRSTRYHCAYCGFYAGKALKLSYHEPSEKWEPACPLCFDSIYLDIAEESRKNGTLIAVDGISQGSLNNLIHYHWMLKNTRGEQFERESKLTQQMLSRLTQHQSMMRPIYGKDTHELELFVGVLDNLASHRYKRRAEIIKPVRYFNCWDEDYEILIKYWAKQSYPRMVPAIEAAIAEREA